MDHNELARKIKVKESDRRGARIQYTLIHRLTIFFLVLLWYYCSLYRWGVKWAIGLILCYGKVQSHAHIKRIRLQIAWDDAFRGEAGWGRTTHR